MTLFLRLSIGRKHQISLDAAHRFPHHQFKISLPSRLQPAAPRAILNVSSMRTLLRLS